MKSSVLPHTDRFGRRGFLVAVEYEGRKGYTFRLTLADANQAFQEILVRLFNGLSPMGGLVDTIEEACGEPVPQEAA